MDLGTLALDIAAAIGRVDAEVVLAPGSAFLPGVGTLAEAAFRDALVSDLECHRHGVPIAARAEAAGWGS